MVWNRIMIRKQISSFRQRNQILCFLWLLVGAQNTLHTTRKIMPAMKIMARNVFPNWQVSLTNLTKNLFHLNTNYFDHDLGITCMRLCLRLYSDFERRNVRCNQEDPPECKIWVWSSPNLLQLLFSLSIAELCKPTVISPWENVLQEFLRKLSIMRSYALNKVNCTDHLTTNERHLCVFWE